MSANTILSRVLRGRPATLALVGLLVLTRFGHFGEFSRLPDASWAVFFLGGLLVRDARAFAAFFALAWVVDLGAMALGTPADCFSLAYLFLVPAYGALWWSGRALAGRYAAVRDGVRPDGVVAVLRAAGLTVLVLAGATALAFALSNLGFWAFGSGFGPLAAGAYAARVAVHFPGYLLVTFAYAFLVMGAHFMAGRLAVEARRSA